MVCVALRIRICNGKELQHVSRQLRQILRFAYINCNYEAKEASFTAWNMDEQVPLSEAFVELIPLSTAAHSSTFLRPNLRHIVNDPGIASRATYQTQRTVKLTFAYLLGRRCLTFGSARSNDYQLLPATEVDAHHFVLYPHPQRHVLCVRNTSPFGIYCMSPDRSNRHITNCDEAIEIVSSLQIRLGGKDGPGFELKNPRASSFDESDSQFMAYLDSVKHHTSSRNSHGLRAAKDKRRRSSATTVSIRKSRKRRCEDGGLEAEQASSTHVSHFSEEARMGWTSRIKRGIWSLCGWGLV